MTLVAVAVAVNDHVNDHVIGRERKTHLNQKGHAGAFGARECFQISQTSTDARKMKLRKFRASFSKRMAIRLKRLIFWKKASTKCRSL